MIAHQPIFASVPSDTHTHTHTEPLLCSHAECQNRGIRFLYCSACDGPVAQGNFSTRHAHPEVRKFKARGEDSGGLSSSSGTNGSGVDTTATDTSSNDDAVSTTSNSTSDGGDGTSSSSTDRGRRPPRGNVHSNNNNNGGGGPHVVPPQPPQEQCAVAKVSSSSGGDSSNSGNNSDPSPSETSSSSAANNNSSASYSDSAKNKRKSMWIDLLNKRPRNENDGDEMSAWLMAVFAVSDPDRMPSDNVLRGIITSGGGTDNDNNNGTSNTTSSLSEDSNKMDLTSSEDRDHKSTGSLSSSNGHSGDDGSGNDGSSNEDGDTCMAEVEEKQKKMGKKGDSNSGGMTMKTNEVDTSGLEKHNHSAGGGNGGRNTKPSLSFNGSDTSSELYPTSSRTNDNSNTESSTYDSSSDNSNNGRAHPNTG